MERRERKSLSKRSSPLALAVPLSVIALALFACILAAPVSLAQNSGGFPGFFQNLFNYSSRPPPPSNESLRVRTHRPSPKRAPDSVSRRSQDFVSTSATRAPGAPGGSPGEAALFVSVLGDSLAILAGQGLSDSFSDKPEVSITNLAKDLSGLTRDDYYDWPKAARALVAGKQKVDAVVIMVGINDLQPLKDGGDTLDPLSDKWRTVYAQRIENFVAPFHDAHIPIFWVGLPPMQDEKFNAQVSALNEIYRDTAEKAGATYIDIWDAFVDENGHFSAFGPDVDGQNTKLRSGPNGIYFTKAGSRKLAHFLETGIRRILDKAKPQSDIAALPPDIEQQADDINAEIRREMGASNPNVPVTAKPPAGPILSLTARPVSAQGELIEAAAPASAGAEASSLRSGAAPEPEAGRADDFRWPRPQ